MRQHRPPSRLLQYPLLQRSGEGKHVGWSAEGEMAQITPLKGGNSAQNDPSNFKHLKEDLARTSSKAQFQKKFRQVSFIYIYIQWHLRYYVSRIWRSKSFQHQSSFQWQVHNISWRISWKETWNGATWCPFWIVQVALKKNLWGSSGEWRGWLVGRQQKSNERSFESPWVGAPKNCISQRKTPTPFFFKKNLYN